MITAKYRLLVRRQFLIIRQECGGGAASLRVSWGKNPAGWRLESRDPSGYSHGSRSVCSGPFQCSLHRACGCCEQLVAADFKLAMTYG